MPQDTHEYVCPDCGFTSANWPTKKAAAERGEEHQAEHETGEPMRELTTPKGN